jgi:hypothetical protein
LHFDSFSRNHRGDGGRAVKRRSKVRCASFLLRGLVSAPTRPLKKKSMGVKKPLADGCGYRFRLALFKRLAEYYPSPNPAVNTQKENNS